MAANTVTNGREMTVSVTGHDGTQVLYHFRECEIAEEVEEFDATTDADGTARDWQPGMSQATIRLSGFLDDTTVPEWPGVMCTWECKPLGTSNPSMKWSGSGFLQSVTSRMEKVGAAGYDAVIRVKGQINKTPTPTPSITASPFDV